MYIKSLIALVLSWALLAQAASSHSRRYLHARYHRHHRRNVAPPGTYANKCGGGIDALYNIQNQNGSIYAYGDAAASRKTFNEFGSCGLSTYPKDVPTGTPLVAMPESIMNCHGGSQYNKLCGRLIEITGPNGKTLTAAVADTNRGGDNSIDMCSDLWTGFGGKDGDGSVMKIQWKLKGSNSKPSGPPQDIPKTNPPAPPKNDPKPNPPAPKPAAPYQQSTDDQQAPTTQQEWIAKQQAWVDKQREELAKQQAATIAAQKAAADQQEAAAQKQYRRRR